MRIKAGQIISEAKGKIAGAVFVRSSSGAYMRQKVSPINPRTKSQQSNRILQSNVTQSWRNLTEAQRLAWDSVAPSFNHTNAFGDNVPLTGFGLYTRINRNRQLQGKPFLDFPPNQVSIIGLTSLSLDIIPLTQEMILSFTPDVPITQVLILYATPPFSAGVSNAGFKYRKIGLIASGQASPQNIRNAYVSIFRLFPKTGQKVFVKAKPLANTSALDGVAVITSSIVPV